MPVYQCPECGKALSVPDDWSGKVIRCPRCSGKFRVPDASPAQPPRPALPPSSASADPSVADAEDGQTDIERDDEAATTGDMAFTGADTRQPSDAKQPSSPRRALWWWALMDFKFEHYLTPWIIRFSWLCVVVLAVAWLLFLGFGFVANSFSSPQPTIPTMPAGGGMNDLLDELISAASRQESTISAFSSFPWRLMMLFTSVIVIVLTVLWTRVFLEMLIVIFNMAKSLKSIDEKLS